MESVLRYELDDYGKIGITLARFDTLQELDTFLKTFSDSNEVKERYLDKINAFLNSQIALNYLLDYQGRENNGYIREYSSDGYRLRPVPLLFKTSLVNEKEAFQLLRESLKQRSILEDIYQRKFFILPTRYLKDELNHHLYKSGTNRYFIRDFLLDLKAMEAEKRYFTLRVLSDKCSLLREPRKKTDNVYKIVPNNLNKLTNGYHLERMRRCSKREKIDEEITPKLSLREDADTHFAHVFQACKGDLATLLASFDIEQIERNTNYFDLENKKRGR